MPAITYSALSGRDRLLIARDRLRSIEQEHFRATLAEPDDTVAADRVAALAPKIKEIQTLVAKLEKENPDVS